MRRTVTLTFAILASSATALAVPPGRPPQRAGLRPTAAVMRPPSPPPAPVVPVQLAGLRVGPDRLWSAVHHALQRDAWAALTACTTPEASARGSVHVELVTPERGLRLVRVRSTGRPDAALEQCVRRAAARIVLPPREEDVAPATPVTAPPADAPTEPAAAPEDVVSFDVVYGLPRLTRR
jgi:hypothetical protein